MLMYRDLFTLQLKTEIYVWIHATIHINMCTKNDKICKCIIIIDIISEGEFSFKP